MHAFEDLETTADKAAKRLLGCELHRKIGDQTLIVKIVETEGYDQNDPGSHSFVGVTPRTKVMFGPSGYLYVYLIYGMYYCMNIVTGPKHHGEAVLIRAVEPISGIDLMENNRGVAGINLSNGPGKLCQALKINTNLNGHNLLEDPLKLVMKPAVKSTEIVTSTRIGLSKAQEMPWRFYMKNSDFVSRRFITDL